MLKEGLRTKLKSRGTGTGGHVTSFLRVVRCRIGDGSRGPAPTGQPGVTSLTNILKVTVYWPIKIRNQVTGKYTLSLYYVFRSPVLDSKFIQKN